MMKRYSFAYLFLFFSELIFSQSTLTLKECLALAKENNKRIESARFEMESAKFEVRSARANFFPSYSMTAIGMYSSADNKIRIEEGMLPVIGKEGIANGAAAYFPGIDLRFNADRLYGAFLKMKQPIYAGGKVKLGYKMMKLRKGIALFNKERIEEEVLLETARAYTNVIRATELRKTAETYHLLLQELMNSVEKSHKQGITSRNDVLKVEVRLHESELSLRQTENALKLATMSLCHYIGHPLSEQIQIDTSLPEANEEDSYPIDISARPEVKILKYQSELTRLNTQYTRSEMLPDIGLIGIYGYMNGLKVNNQPLFDDRSFSVGVQINVPLFHFGKQMNKYRSTQAQYRKILSEETEKKELMTLEMMQAANKLDEAKLQYKLAQTAVTSANENLRVSNKLYLNGTEKLTDYLQAQVLWQQANQSLINSEIDLFLCKIQYHKSIGQPIESLF